MKESDRYFTSPQILDVVRAQWGSIDLDPAWDPECEVQAKQVFDIRRGEDGLALPWHGKVFLNPPYSAPSAWLARAAQHGASGGEVLALTNASTGTRAWRISVWDFASIAFLYSRPKFRKFGSSRWTENPKDSAVCFYSADPQLHHQFGVVWAPHGHVVRAPWLPCPMNSEISVATGFARGAGPENTVA